MSPVVGSVMVLDLPEPAVSVGLQQTVNGLLMLAYSTTSHIGDIGQWHPAFPLRALTAPAFTANAAL